MDFHTEESSSYRVEVSGWDTHENFFVEKTLLGWEPGGLKEIMLRAVVRKGAVVFVRLLQTISTGSNFPIAYQAMEIAEKDRTGPTRIRLEQLRPRESMRELLATPADGSLDQAEPAEQVA